MKSISSSIVDWARCKFSNPIKDNEGVPVYLLASRIADEINTALKFEAQSTAKITREQQNKAMVSVMHDEVVVENKEILYKLGEVVISLLLNSESTVKTFIQKTIRNKNKNVRIICLDETIKASLYVYASHRKASLSVT